MSEAAELARGRNVRLHTHLAETEDEEEFCLQKFGVRPVEFLEELGWLGEDVGLRTAYTSTTRKCVASAIPVPAARIALLPMPGSGPASLR